MAATAQVDAGQHDAARALYEQYYPSVYRYALSQVRSPQDAEDAAQNTFLRAFSALQRGTVPENESAWLFKIAHNVCASSRLAWLRRRRVEAPRDLDALPIEPAAREVHRDELVGLGDALSAMPPRLREAFLLREWQGLSYAEIATRLDTSHSAVETLIFRARRALAAELESPLRKVRQALGLGPLLSTLRSIVQGAGPAAKAAAVLVVAGGATVASQPLLHHSAPAKDRTPPPAARATVVPVTSAPSTGGASHQVVKTRAQVSERRTQPRSPSTPPPAASAPSIPPAAVPPASTPPTETPASKPAEPLPTIPPPPFAAPAVPPVVAVPGLPQVPTVSVPTVTVSVPTVTVSVPAIPALPKLP